MFGRLTHCCCFRVRTGALIFGTLGISGAVLCLGIYSFLYDNNYAIDEKLDEVTLQLNDAFEKGEIDRATLIKIEYYIALFKEYFPALCIAMIVCAVVGVIQNTALVYGVLGKRHHFMLPWMILAMLGLVFNMVLTVATVVVNLMYVGIGNALFTLVIHTLFLALGFYFWNVVFSHFRAVKAETKEDHKILIEEEQIPPTYEKVVGGGKY